MADAASAEGEAVSVRIITGNALEQLRLLPNESVHCCISSPPYYGLRDYGTAGQIGLETSPAEYVEALVCVFREVRRVLRPDGTAWVNLGDSYASGGRATYLSGASDNKGQIVQNDMPRPVDPPGIKPKDLIGTPWMVAFALRTDGWYLRSEIVWAKPNPMPESVRDRPTSAHEKIFLLSKSERYYYDADAIAEMATNGERFHGGYGALGPHGLLETKSRNGRISAGGNSTTTRNRRNVWTIATEPYPDAHFATFPPALVEPCILAGTSEKGCCGACGAPWVRQIEKEYRRHDNWFGNKQDARHSRGKAGTAYNEPIGTKTTGWQPSCACAAAVVPATVLDPFAGAGTTGIVADRLGRDAVLIELNPEYAAMAERRLHADAPLFAEIAAE